MGMPVAWLKEGWPVQTDSQNEDGDSFSLIAGRVPAPHRTPTDWLIGEAIRTINRDDSASTVVFEHVINLLIDRKDTSKCLLATYDSVPIDDICLRWTLLHILAKVGRKDAAKPLVSIALVPLPAHDPRDGCSGRRLSEALIRIASVVALSEIAGRHRGAAQALLDIVEARPEPPVMIEALKALRALDMQSEAEKLLDKKSRWMLDIRKAEMSDFAVEHERWRADRTPGAPRLAVPGREPPKTCGCG